MADEDATQSPATTGEGNQPEGTGYAPPAEPSGDSAESEIPQGVDALSDEAIQAAQERGGASDDEGGDGGAVDVSAALADANDEPEGEAAAEAQAETEEAEAKTEGDAETEG